MKLYEFKALVADLPDLDIIISNTSTDPISGKLECLIGHDSDFEKVVSARLGKIVWLRINGGTYKWRCEVRVGPVIFYNLYRCEETPITTVPEVCAKCDRYLEDYYEGIPAPGYPPGYYCPECWEGIVDA